MIDSQGQISQSGGQPASLPAAHELERQLAELDAGAEADAQRRIDLLNRLAWELSDTDSQRAIALSAAAYDLASASPADAPAKDAGIAYSLRTQGYINQRFGNYPEGLKQLMRAMSIFESQGRADGLADVLDGLAAIYAQTGNFPEALAYAHRQLATAQQLGDIRRTANAYNNFSCIYAFTGDLERAVAIQQQNLQIAVETGYARIACIASMNLAALYLETGDPMRAHEHALAGLRWSQEAGFEVLAVYALQTLGNVCLLMDDPLQAIHYKEQALLASRAMESKVTESLNLLNLGKAYQALGRFDAAQKVLHEAVAVAEALNAGSELSTAHQFLSELYEQIGDPARALIHFKQHHAQKEIVAGEKANQRLQVLKVIHDTEQARKEAEIAQLHAGELQKEVAARTVELTATVAQLQNEVKERERAEAEIQQMVATLERRVAARTDELATFFDLTLLAGEVPEMGEVFEQILERVMELTSSRGLCIHLLDSEQATLHLAGQQNLAQEARQALQAVTLTGRFARWMQQPHDPLMATELAALDLLPAVFRLAGFRTYLGAQIKAGGRTAGLLSCYRFTDRGYGLDEIAMVTALAGQLGIMLESQRLRRDAQAMAVLEERQRLARDLHDSVTQSLYSLALFSRAGREAVEDGDTARLAYNLNEVERNTLHALREMRLLLYELRPSDLQEVGLARAIQMRLDSVERRAGLKLDVELDELPLLPSNMEVELYHIIAEALTNVIKHAAAGKLTVHLKHATNCMELTIADDGMGFDPLQTSGGMGLSNIRARVARLGGQITIDSTTGRGTQVTAWIPEPAGEWRQAG